MIEKFCKKADKTKAELSELLNNKNTQNDTLEKLVIFISNFNKKCIISTFDGYSEKGKIGKQFLGFEHSERKKYEGIRPFPNNEDGVVLKWADRFIFGIENNKITEILQK